MSRLRDFVLPDLGEGLTEGEILQWLVAVGDTVTLNQPIVEVETAKAEVEIPSPFAGVVTALHRQAGEVVDVGAVIISFDTEPGAGPLDLVPDPPRAEGALIGEVGANGRTATLVGYGPRSGPSKRRARTDSPAPVVAHAELPLPETAA
ncbi:MAG: branched-chain alpha-keto acid dehydrogenase subunit, partial [Frankiales bacterium]|nr:branched-chain alpha-keto acid dehydrogenase subunit [Frankiales bacterium]